MCCRCSSFFLFSFFFFLSFGWLCVISRNFFSFFNKGLFLMILVIYSNVFFKDEFTLRYLFHGEQTDEFWDRGRIRSATSSALGDFFFSSQYLCEFLLIIWLLRFYLSFEVPAPPPAASIEGKSGKLLILIGVIFDLLLAIFLNKLNLIELLFLRWDTTKKTASIYFKPVLFI